MIELRLIPVLDILNGVVVRGVAGRRSEYRPLVSQLTSSIDPVDVARALIAAVHPQEIYLADLDAIQDGEASSDAYRAILGLGMRLWVDAGVRNAADAMRLADCGCDIIAGLETVPSPEVLQEIVNAVGAERTIFSLDLRDGMPMRNWGADAAIATGIRRVIVLDLARVGGSSGTGTEQLCRNLASTYPHLEVIAGGGVRGPEDLQRLEVCGVKAVLVASALHDKKVLSTTSATRTSPPARSSLPPPS
jgi:phosphoribosylformimino-5-aminoimidazole carboxamide ribotide isomerase